MNVRNVRKMKQDHWMQRALPAFVLLMATTLFLSGCGEKIGPGNSPVKRPIISGVSLATLSSAPIEEFYEATGTVRADHTTSVSGRMMGAVASLRVKEGDVVQNGQLLLTIDDRDIIQKVKAAEAGYQEALKALESAKQNRALTAMTWERYQKMFDEKAVSRQELDQFETQKKVADFEYGRVEEMVKRAAAGLKEARILLEFTRVASPIRGRVTEKKIEVGSMAIPGMPLIVLEDISAFHAEATIDESLSSKLKEGMPALVTIESIERQIPSKIKEILPVVDSMSRSFIAKIPLSGVGLRSGLYARVKIPIGRREALVAPQRSIVEKGQLSGVYAVDSQGVVTYQLIRTGKAYQENREILSGLKPNDRIIVQGVEKAIDGGIIENTK